MGNRNTRARYQELPPRRDLATWLECTWDDERSATEAAIRAMASMRIPNASCNTVQKAIRALTHASGCIPVRDLGVLAGLSGRQFRRCLEESDLAPKLLARILRLRRASALAGKGHGSGPPLERGAATSTGRN